MFEFLIKIVHSDGSSILQTGQVLWSFSHFSIHLGWKIWPQGRNKPVSPMVKSAIQIEQVGISVVPSSFFLQCCSSMHFLGILAKTFLSVGLLFSSSYYYYIRWLTKFIKSTKLIACGGLLTYPWTKRLANGSFYWRPSSSYLYMKGPGLLKLLLKFWL